MRPRVHPAGLDPPESLTSFLRPDPERQGEILRDLEKARANLRVCKASYARAYTTPGKSRPVRPGPHRRISVCADFSRLPIVRKSSWPGPIRASLGRRRTPQSVSRRAAPPGPGGSRMKRYRPGRAATTGISPTVAAAAEGAAGVQAKAWEKVP